MYECSMLPMPPRGGSNVQPSCGPSSGCAGAVGIVVTMSSSISLSSDASSASLTHQRRAPEKTPSRPRRHIDDVERRAVDRRVDREAVVLAMNRDLFDGRNVVAGERAIRDQ